MKFRTKLIITFLTILILPLVMTSVAFIGIGLYMTYHAERAYGIEISGYNIFSETLDSYGIDTEDVYEQLRNNALELPEELENREMLDEINRRLIPKYSYLLVRKGDQIYYSGNDIGANKIFDRLPPYGYESEGADVGLLFMDMQKLVRQIDFTFSDGTPGSAFLITKVNNLITRSLVGNVFFSIIMILLITGLFLTRYISRSILQPVNNLNLAMQKIAEGNFDYVLTGDGKGEIGELYHNYEDMRLRLKESTEEKQQAEKTNKELVSNISHDLKTPITAIKGYAEGIMDGVADTPEKVDKYVKTIYNKANDMDRLINELTFYSGMDTNRIPYHFHRINVAEYFEDCVEDVGLDLESRKIQLNYSNLTDRETQIIADPEQLKKVINNIIGNSIKYMDKAQGVIDIRILDELDSIRVEIEDNGKGIAVKDLANIFERFYRTDASRNSAQGGSGIGLSIVKKIIEDHGGYIWATSKEGEGTCMHFVIRKYSEVEENE